MTKNILLAATAVGVLAFAGAAQAHTLSFRAVAPGGPIDSSDANAVADFDPTTTDLVKYGRSLVGLYLIANELTSAGLTGNTVQLADTLSSGAIPSGNNLYTISLTNATFGSAVASGALVGLPAAANCTIAPSSGGAAGDSSVTFLVSSSGAGPCTGFNLDIPVLPNVTGVVTVTTNLRTDNEVPIDGGTASFDAIFPIDAFQPVYNAAFNVNGAGVDTTTTIASTPPYTTLLGDGNLGSAAIYVDTRANRDLVPGAGVPVVLADVTAATVTVTGDFDAFNAALTNATLEGTSATSITPTVATFSTAAGYLPVLLSARSTGTASASNLVVTPDGGSIDSSGYTGLIAYTLTPADFAAQGDAAGAFESIERDGVNFFAPWLQMNSSYIAVLRLSNTGTTDTGPVTLTMRANNGGTVFSTCTLTTPMLQAGALVSGGIGANTAIEVTGKSLADNCFGTTSTNADVQVSIEAIATNLTGKVRVINPGGTVVETSLGRLGDIDTIAY